ncbi:MAG: nucleoside recognition protein [Candidatus Marinimicrobia bacterium]|nr:nucleoside recognition protein [Candidatus Neomarinimicrobiota bacterium]
MINIVWLGLIVIGISVAIINSIVNGDLEPLREITAAAFNMSKTSIELAIGLIGLMMLWLGLMKLAEESGLINIIAKLLRPIMVRLFPDVPADHPAMGAMIMNISANMLGLANAATPLGLKAMLELQKLNKNEETATNAMVTFLALNSSSVTIIPSTIIGIRVATGSADPARVIGTILFATTCSTIVAITLAMLLSKMKRFRLANAISEPNEQKA